ncbi:hypothetical protein KW428_21635 [Vibrio fluvialis]|uniref:hypothetical protein n=1 Tax=Vibrio fluvialis TaxID=676 RepID=UPI001C9BFBBE|nr:hypothetical protein [Vibrio fluvialis]ELS3717366.1 hypothetical protein [Vibrio fluvialis]ELX9694066.1 hypothetical protein [Vibrio fluvialis]MBY7865268.1 hypothetical protein [Vibrio fluvialis]MBY8092538.1 hypothetical protein [Vibrio fluvialis]WMN57872.1 hypothetical protein NI390_16410 [Vibrio fluvialis]
MYSKAKKTVDGVQSGIHNHTRALYNPKFTSKVEQRIHKKGGEFLNYSFMLTYRKWIAALNFAPLIFIFVLMTGKILDLDFPQEVVNHIFLYQGFQAMIPRFLGTIVLGGLVFLSLHIVFGIIFAFKYKIGLLFVDFLRAGISGSLQAGAMWGFALFMLAQVF